MTLLEAIEDDLKRFLKSDPTFKKLKFIVRIEEGTDANKGINIYEVAYDIEDGKEEEQLELLLEYYETKSNRRGSTDEAVDIKDRAKIFYNWINRRYSAQFGDSIKDKCDRINVTDIRSSEPMGFFVDDKKNHIVALIKLIVFLRNAHVVDV